jgi:glycosyltransferase involved in cell wall biosynthesis
MGGATKPYRQTRSMEAARLNRIVALLGARDTPTDAIEDYCHWLGRALDRHGVSLEVVRVNWPALGWRRALDELRGLVSRWRAQSVLVQYTPLSWSHRSVPLHLPRILRMLRRAGARPAVVFHDPSGSPVRQGAVWWKRLGDRVRRRWQYRVLRKIYSQVDRAFFTISPDNISWLRADRSKASLLPAGANVPTPQELGLDANRPHDGMLVVAIFGISGMPSGSQELSLLERALRRAAITAPRFRVVALGRGTDQAADGLARVARSCGVAIEVKGLIDAHVITRTLFASDVQLFFRGGISSRRGTVAAGLSCGLPIVAFHSTETAPPVTEAGVRLVPEGDAEALGEALGRVLADPEHRAELSARSRAAHQKWFSWESIAARLLEVLERKPWEG